MKARGRRPSAFIVSRCLETPVKHDARVFDMASKTIHTSLVVEGVLFQCSDFPWDYVFKKQSKCGKFVVVRCKSCGSEDGGVFCSECRTRFRSPKTWEEESKLLKGSIRKSTAYKTKWAIKIFHEWQINRKVQSSCTWCWWRILRLWRFVQSSVVEYRFGKYGCQHLNYWLSKFVQEVANSEEKGYLARTLYEIICGIRKHLEETVGSEVLNRLDTSDKR